MRRRAFASSLVSEGTWLSSLNSFGVSTPRAVSAPLSEQSLYQGCKRLSGPPLPPNGTPIRTRSLERLNERLEHLAFAPRPDGGPPLEAYTVTPSTYGDVVRATQAYVEWFRRTYPALRGADSDRVPAPSPSSEGVGRRRFSQNALD